MADQDCTKSQNVITPEIISRFKRPRSTPMLCTPYREEKRVPLCELISIDTLHVAARPVSLFTQPSTTVSISHYSENALKVNFSSMLDLLQIGQME